jgi:UDP-glucuronate 4-epimerase
MRTLITGGAGFIAFHLAAKLLAEGHELALLDNFNHFYDPGLKRRNIHDLQSQAPITLYEVDILETNNLRCTFKQFRPDIVIHLAAWAGVRPSLEKPALYSDVNVTGTVNVLDLAREHNVKCFIFGSSSSVYGGNEKTPFSENDAVDRPVSPYAATKKAGELLCHTYSHNYSMHTTCLRFFTVYGPRQRPEMAIHKFAQCIWQNQEIPVYGNGESRRDYTYVDDIVSGILAAINVNHRFAVINLGESQTTGLLELIHMLEQSLGKKARLRFLPNCAGDMLVTYADIQLARQLLGYDPQVPITEGIQRFTSWFRGLQ